MELAENGNTCSGIVKYEQARKNLQECLTITAQDNPELAFWKSNLQTNLLWTLARDASELGAPVPINGADLVNLERDLPVQPELCDIMLAEISQLGHIDKVPRPYDWEDLLPTLRPDEELLWIVHKPKTEGGFKLYVGIKFNRNDLGDPSALEMREERFQILVNSFSKCLFPESVVKRIENFKGENDDQSGETIVSVLEKLRKTSAENAATSGLPIKEIFCVSGMPSPKDLEVDRLVSERKEDVRSFLSLNDAIEPHLYTDSAFTVVFSVSAASASDIRTSFDEKFALRDTIKPFMEQSVQFSEGMTEGTGISITPAHKTSSTTTAEKHGFFNGLYQSVFKKNPLSSAWSRLRFGDLIGAGKELVSSLRGAETYSPPPSITENYVPESKSESSHRDVNRGSSKGFTVTRSDLKFVDDQLDKELKHLQQTLGGGGYFATAMVYAEKDYIGESIARSIRATLSGSHSYLAPLKVFRFAAPDFYQLRYNRPIAEILRDLGARPLVLNRDSACLALLLPDADLPGCSLKKSVFYARPKPLAKTKMGDNHKNRVSFGIGAYYEGGITDETLLPPGYKGTFDFTIPANDLFSHTFIVGAPGGGKSKRAGYILNHIPVDTRLVVLETAKREYADVLRRDGRKIVRYTLGNSKDFPFRINPFFFDPGTGLKQHIAVLADAIADLLPMEALIGPKLREAVERCYRRCGWDIETGEQMPSASGLVKYPDMLMFNSEVAKVCAELSDYGPEVRSNYTGALKNRASIFIDDLYQDIFAFDGDKTIDELFPFDADIVIEMEDMPPSEINMPAFIISIVLQRLRAYRFLHKGDPGNRFVVAIEEAHNVLSRKIEQSGGDERQSGKGGHLLNQVLRLLAEGRGLGLGLIVIDQAAHAIAPSVLADTNTKVILRLEDGEEIKTIGTSIGLEEKDWTDLQRLATGECIVKTKTSPVPVKLAPLRFADSTALVLEPGEIPFEETSPTLPEGVPERLLRPPYIQAGCLLKEILARGLLSRIEAITLAKGVMRLSSPSLVQRDLIRYVFGCHLFRQGRIELLDDHLDYPESPMPYEATARYYAQFLRRLMSDEDGDEFLSFILNLSDDDTGATHAKTPGQRKVKAGKVSQQLNGIDSVALRQLKAGAAKTLRILCEDCAEFGIKDVFDNLSDILNKVETKTDFSNFAVGFACMLKSSPPIQYEWRELCEHLYPYWSKKSSPRDVSGLLTKYGIEEEDI